MHGIILNLYWGEDPVTVSAKGTPSALRRRVTIDPGHTAAVWPADQVIKKEATSKRSTETGEMLGGWICERVRA